MDQFIVLEKRDKTAIVTLNRPNVLNAMNRDAIFELRRILGFVEDDKEIRAIVITGTGKSFCVGMDLNDARKFDTKTSREFAKLLHDTCFQIENMGKPVIAAVNGYALGLGLELAMSCDVRVASVGATFGQPEVKLGIIPGAGGTQRLPLIVGRSKAKEMIFTGDSIDADEAYRVGLIDMLVEEGALIDEAVSLAGKMNTNSLNAIRVSKYLINKSLAQDYQSEQKNFSECFGTADQKEGMTAFFEKRKPVFG